MCQASKQSSELPEPNINYLHLPHSRKTNSWYTVPPQKRGLFTARDRTVLPWDVRFCEYPKYALSHSQDKGSKSMSTIICASSDNSFKVGDDALC